MAEAADSEAQPIHICASSVLEDGGRACVFEVQQYRRIERAFVLRFEGRVAAYLNRCLHVPAPMDWIEGEFFDADKRFIVCSIHGATYEPSDGRCVGGPCGRGKLTALRVEERGGEVYWYPSSDIRPVAFDDAQPAPPLACAEPAGPAGPATGPDNPTGSTP